MHLKKAAAAAQHWQFHQAEKGRERAAADAQAWYTPVMNICVTHTAAPCRRQIDPLTAHLPGITAVGEAACQLALRQRALALLLALFEIPCMVLNPTMHTPLDSCRNTIQVGH